MEIATIVNYFRYKLIGMTESFDSFTYAYYELCMLIQHSTSLSLRDGHHRNKEAEVTSAFLLELTCSQETKSSVLHR